MRLSKANEIESLKLNVEGKKKDVVGLNQKIREVEDLLERNVSAHQESVRFLEKENLDLMLEVKRLKKKPTSSIDTVLQHLINN